jgi:hypothetical protein
MPKPAGNANVTIQGILFIDDYRRYTSVWLLPNKKAKTCTSTYQSYQARVDSMGYEIKQFWCDNG